MESLSLGLSLPLWVAIFLTGLALGVAIVTYRSLGSMLPRGRRYTLLLLRACGLIALVLVLGDLFVSHSSYTTLTPDILVVVDNSESMRELSGEISRFNRGRKMVNRVIEHFGRERIRLVSLRGQSGSGAVDRIEDVIPDVQWSDLSEPADNVVPDSESKPGAIVLVSDGRHNGDENPRVRWHSTGVPVTAIIPGDTMQKNYLSIESIRTNREGYPGVTQPVSILINANVASRMKVDVVLGAEGRRSASRPLELLPTTSDYTIAIPFTPGSTGRTTITCSILPFDDDVATTPSASTTIDVADMSTNLLLLGGTPGPDLAFARRKLEAMPDMTVSTILSIDRGSNLKARQALREAEVLVLSNYPTTNTGTEEIDMVISAVRSRMIPLLVLAGPDMEMSKLLRFGDLLPFRTGGRLGSQVESQVTDPAPNSDRYRQLTGLTYNSGSLPLAPDAAPLLVSTRPEGEVVAATIETPLRSTMVRGWGLWRWELLDKGRTEARGENGRAILDEFLTEVVRRLGRASDEEELSVQSNKSRYLRGEPIVVDARLTTAHIEDSNSITTTLFLRGPASVTREMTPGSSRMSRARLTDLTPGTYTYSATATYSGNELSSRVRSFTVEETSVETTETGPGVALMRGIAERTNGFFATERSIDSILTVMETRPELAERTDRIMTETPLRKSLPFLLLTLAFFSAEWILRRKWSLP